MAGEDGRCRLSTEDTLLAEETLLKLELADAMVESENREERFCIFASMFDDMGRDVVSAERKEGRKARKD